ncbi:MAG: hypothetical protein ACI8RZ_004530 [Myxococcota bacterium]|jgi:hypothetical protein
MLLMMLACASYDFDPPDTPRHSEQESETDFNGAPIFKSGRHADLMDDPYLCKDPSTGNAVACPDTRPADENLSCDASGCHGDFDYSSGFDRSTRHLRGSDGPSCYSCHNQEWSGRQE